MAAGIGPAASQEISVPTRQRRGRDEERRPSFPRHSPNEEGEHSPLRSPEPRTPDLARVAAPLVATLNMRSLELIEAIRPLAERIMALGEVPRRNNMGLVWPS